MKNSAFPSLILITESHIIFIETFIILPIKILQRIFNKFYKLLIFRYFTNMILLIFSTCLFLVKYGILNIQDESIISEFYSYFFCYVTMPRLCPMCIH